MSSEIRPAYGLERVKLSEVTPLPMPFTVFLSVSTVCNFKCKYCIHALSKNQLTQKGFIPQIMSWETFTLAAEQIKRFPSKVKTIFLYGVGEPLCNRLLPRMVKHLKDLDITEQIAFITNGALLDKSMSLALVNAGIDTIRFSIQGLSSEKYKEICGINVDFNDLLRNISYLYRNKSNCEIFVKIADIALDNGDESRFYDIFKEISDRMFIERIVPVFHDIDYSDMIREGAITDLWGNEHETRMVCPICFYTLTVFPNGDVYPCCMESDPANLGNIAHTSLTEIWNGKQHLGFLKMQLKKNRMHNAICRHCTAPDTSAKLEDELDSCADIVLSRM
jgi:radical SAM protein with 4Fe4S-binding SPASM domain